MRPYAVYIRVLCLAVVITACGESLDRQQLTQASYGDVQVVIDGSILGSELATQATGGLGEIGVLETEGIQSLFLLGELIIYLGEENQQAKLDGFLRRYNATLLDDGSIPAPPPEIPSSQLRDVPASPFRLVALTPPRTDLSRLAQRLESRGASGVVKFSSREAADLYNFTLILSANEGGLSISGEPNWLLEPTYSEHRINTSGSYLQTQNIDNLVNLNVSTSSGAWTLKDKQLRPLDGRGGVWIAIIDTGFEYSDSNTSLRNYELTRYNPITNSYSGLFRNIVSYDFVRGSYNVYANEDSWHGTHSAVMAAGARGNNYGTAGVAPAANLMLFRIGYSKSMLAYAARAVQTANAWGADVISMSFSANAPGCTDWASNFLYELRRAESASIVNVASAGNNNAPFDKACHTWGNYPIPAAYREVIAVGAHDRALNRSVWNDSGSSASNYGPMVEIWAPGGGSRNQPGYIDLRLYSTPTPNQTFCWSNNRCANEAVSSVNRPFQYSGTSAAAPQIAGIAALMKQVNPAVTTAQARHVLITTGRRDSSHAHVTVRADAAAALRNLGAK